MDMNKLMKQAQSMQANLQAAQARVAESTAEGTAGGGLVKLILKGSGDIVSLVIDPGVLTDGDAEDIADLVKAAHADAKRTLDAASAEALRAAAGPLAGMLPGMGF